MNYVSVWGMHLVWWFFWISLVVLMFGFDLPEKVRVSSRDPVMILKRRRARGELTADEYESIRSELAEGAAALDTRAVPAGRPTGRDTGGHPLVVGLTLSISLVILYSLCAVVYWISPNAIVTATSKLFHGLSFTQMSQAGSGFGLGDYFSVVTIGALYALVAGVIGSSIHAFLRRRMEPNRSEKQSSFRPQLRPRAQ